MKILGIQSYFPDSSACLLKDGKILSAAQEERLSRQKRTRLFPANTINFCLNQAKATLKDIDTIAFPVNPAIYLENFDSAHTSQLRYRGEILYSVLSQLMANQPQQAFADHCSQILKLKDGTNINIEYVEHHLSHAAIGFYPSPFKEAAILSVDGFGEKDCILFAHGKGNDIKPLFRQEFPHSIGCLYLTITEFLGFKPNSDEWKVMGASSYGDPNVYFDKLWSLFNFKGDGFEMNLNYFNYYQFHRPLSYSPKLVELLGPARRADEKMTQRHFDISAATQKVTEKVIYYLAERLKKKTGLKNLCFTGGVAMNSVLNGKILAHTSFDDLYVPFAPDDTGTSIGAALYVAHQLKNRKRVLNSNNYLGPGFSEADIKKELDKFGLNYERVADPAKEAARLIAQGKIIGWFQGNLEFGDRALGNRSILADARVAEMRDTVNIKIKFREEFRPFAPSILHEHTSEYFEDATPTNYMEKVYQVKKSKRNTIPAVVHVDGSGRLQTVNRNINPLYYSLIEQFYKLTGVPVVLNTSFNLKGEPIVGSPKDAVRTFYTCGMNALVIGNYVIKK